MQNYADPAVMVLFASSEKAIRTDLLDGEEIEVVEYRSSVEKFIQRLEIMGYTLAQSEAGLNEWAQTKSEEVELNEAEKAVFSDFTFDVWKSCMRLILKHRISRWDVKERLPNLEIPKDLQPYILLILNRFEFEDLEELPEDRSYEDHSFSILAGLYGAWRAILEVCDPSASVVFDYSSLIDWGSYGRDEDLTIEPEKIVVLTEGKSDTDFIEGALRLLYPELVKYYSFLDFHSPRLGGGTSFLVHLVKGFVGAGIHNKIIAIFDNDTAAQEALRPMRGVSLPESMRILPLPCLELAKDYPTLGPQGTVNLDINGLACSIELFFGRDILQDETGRLTPIQWTGFNRTLNKYQGEILNKKELQSQYRDLISQSTISNVTAKGHDWSGMDLLLKTIFTAFRQPQRLAA